MKSVWVTYIITLSDSMYEPSMMSLDCNSNRETDLMKTWFKLNT
jgi:hypothetical protein